MRNIIKKENGITLITLVIIIIIIAILGGILINISIGNISLFGKAKNGADEYRINAVKEKLELARADFYPKSYNLQEYLNNLEKKNITNSHFVSEVDEHTADVVIDGFIFRITDDANNDGVEDGYITYEYISPATDGEPSVFIKNISTTTGSITINVESVYAKNGEYTYYIKEAEANDNTYTKSGDKTTETTHTFGNLTKDKIYTVKVVLEVSGKNDATDQQNARTLDMASLAAGEYSFADNPDTWTNTDVEVTVSITNQEVANLISNGTYIIQTKLNDGYFENTNQQTATNQNDMIFAVVSDGYGNFTSAASHQIKFIDKQKPTNTAPTLSSKTTSTIVANYQQQDLAPEEQIASELNNEEKKFRLTNSEGTTGTWQSTGTFEGLTHGQTYYVQTKAQDIAGNEQLSQVLTVELGEVSNATNGSISPAGYTNQDVTITLPTQSGFTTRYTTNGDNPTKNSTQYNGPFTVQNNCTIKYVYSDGTNIGGAGTAQVDKIEKQAPTINTQLSGTTNVSDRINTSITATDTGSGLGQIIWYYKKSTDENYTQATPQVYTTLNGETAGATTQQTKEYTLSGLTAGTTYNIYAVVYDVAGNSTQSSTITVSTIGTSIAVARIGSVYYQTLQSAFDEVPNNNTETTVTLVNNITNERTELFGSQNVKLDLNGKTFLNENEFGEYNICILSENVKLTIIGSGTITNNQREAIYSYGNVTLSGGTYNSMIWSWGSLTINNSSVTINNGSSPAVYFNNSLTVTAGTIQSNSNAAICMIGGTATISGGNISTGSFAALDLHEGTATITGGTWSGDTSKAIYIRSGICNFNGGTAYSNSSQAIYLVNGTCNFNGGTAYSNSSQAIYLSNGTLTIDGGTVEKTDNSTTAIYINNGTFNMISGTIKSYSTKNTINMSNNENISASITGGTIEQTIKDNATGYPAIWIKNGTWTIGGSANISTVGTSVYNNGGALTINSNATITSSNISAVQNNAGSTTVNGGTFRTNSGNYALYKSGGEFTYNGGTMYKGSSTGNYKNF